MAWAKPGKKNYEGTKKKLKDKFVRDYPYAKLDQLEFRVELNKDGTTNGTDVRYKGDGKGRLYDITGTTWKGTWSITSNVFKYKYSDALTWGPSSGVFQPTTDSPFRFTLGNEDIGFHIRQFKVYVTKDDSFQTNFPELNTVWGEKVNGISKAKIDFKNEPYFASLCAAFVIFFKSGICKEHFRKQGGVNPIVTSIFRYYAYYHIGGNELETIRKLIPKRRVWETKTLYGVKEIPSHWLPRQPNKANIRNVRYVGYSDTGGVTGIKYEEVKKITNQSNSDWKKFIQTTSNGMNKRGQLLLQKAIESYVYCILGAQVQTRWPIVGQGAKSF